MGKAGEKQKRQPKIKDKKQSERFSKPRGSLALTTILMRWIELSRSWRVSLIQKRRAVKTALLMSANCARVVCQCVGARNP